MTRLNVSEAVCEALFASPLQPSDRPTAETVAHAIGSTMRRLGPAGCASHMAQESIVTLGPERQPRASRYTAAIAASTSIRAARRAGQVVIAERAGVALWRDAAMQRMAKLAG